MAERKYFISINGKYKELLAEFEYFSGFAKTQKYKSRDSLHNKIKEKYPNARILEVSTKSQDKELGQRLSAVNLTLNNYALETVFQSSKIFYDSHLMQEVNFKHLLYEKPLVAKREVRNFKSINKTARLIKFKYNDKIYNINPKSYFYDYIYILALIESKLGDKLVDYDIFTDIEFNHKKSFNTQARACAIYSYMLKNNKVDYYLKSDENFLSFYKDFVAYCELF